MDDRPVGRDPAWQVGVQPFPFGVIARRFDDGCFEDRPAGDGLPVPDAAAAVVVNHGWPVQHFNSARALMELGRRRVPVHFGLVCRIADLRQWSGVAVVADAGFVGPSHVEVFPVELRDVVCRVAYLPAAGFWFCGVVAVDCDLVHEGGDDVLVRQECDGGACLAECPGFATESAVVDGVGAVPEPLQDARSMRYFP